MASASQLRTLNRLRAEALATLPLGIDAGEIDGPVWSVSDRGTAGALDRVAQIPARPCRLGHCDSMEAAFSASLASTSLVRQRRCGL